MKKYLVIIAYFSLLILTTSLAFMPIDRFEITDAFSLTFKSADPSGSFKKMEGTIDFNEQNLAKSKFNLSIDISTIKTGNGMRDKKAQTEEWFSAKKYPNIKFVSKTVEKEGDLYKITGDLTLKGTTKVYVVKAKKSGSGNTISFAGSINVNRMDFKIGKKSDVVPDIMKVSFDLPAEKK
jgi:polyisoprenoid-binding protein YceI